jgi:hypothetical protein
LFPFHKVQNFAGGIYLLILEPGLDEVEREDARDADDAGDAPVHDLGQERELRHGRRLGGVTASRGRHLYGFKTFFSKKNES